MSKDKGFITEDFLLDSPTARELYHSYGEKLPIIDYHCHLDAEEIAKNEPCGDLAQVWLGGDHYKWRVMRASGVEECYITGDAPGYEKFLKFAEILPLAIGNPVYHWCHLELLRFFHCDLTINAENAKEIYTVCSEKLQSLRPLDLIRQSNVRAICTIEEPESDLKYHGQLKATASDIKILPSFRPDDILNEETPDYDYILQRLDHFEKLGCKTADHGITELVPGSGTYKTLLFLCEQYAARGWVCQFHMGPARNLNSSMNERVGVNTGFDAINPGTAIKGVARLLDELNSRGALPKSVIFSLNPIDNAAITTMCGCFPNVQQGAAWWFNDTLPGMYEHLTNFAATGVLGTFLGMLTDSRSLLSYPRHEYFRRILCNFLGRLAEEGQCPRDVAMLGDIVERISFHNANGFFDFQV